MFAVSRLAGVEVVSGVGHDNQALNLEAVYAAIARNLREFGYSDVTPQMIRETDEARQNGAGPSEPYGIVSMFANRQLSEAEEASRG